MEEISETEEEEQLLDALFASKNTWEPDLRMCSMIRKVLEQPI
jgi:hypothetical protein